MGGREERERKGMGWKERVSVEEGGWKGEERVGGHRTLEKERVRESRIENERERGGLKEKVCVSFRRRWEGEMEGKRYGCRKDWRTY